MKLFKGLFVIVAAVISVTSGAASIDDVDVHGEAICSLPHSAQVAHRSAACFARIPSWTYRLDNNQCVQFEYNGCGGNANRFFTLYACEDACKKY
uniref:BPTI/Kunitz inhibitor domain-containing protein n=1 Tax=Glossina austeni TaxID=7395 RepID=A0A1A9URN3_GLOAU